MRQIFACSCDPSNPSEKRNEKCPEVGRENRGVGSGFPGGFKPFSRAPWSRVGRKSDAKSHLTAFIQPGSQEARGI